MFGSSSNYISVMKKSLDAYSLRNEVIANNIANVDTPGYKKGSVEFETIFEQMLKKSNFDIDSLNPTFVKENAGYNMRIDGNNVDIDVEMSKLAKNNIRYNAVTSQINSEFKRLKQAMK